MQPYVIIKTPSCIKVKLKTHPTLISRANKEYKLRVRTTRTPIGVLDPSYSNFEIDSTSHYRELTTP